MMTTDETAPLHDEAQERDHFTLNLHALEEDFAWLEDVLSARVYNLFREDEAEFKEMPAPPDLHPEEIHYHRLLADFDLYNEERAAMLMVLAPELSPSSLDPLQVKYEDGKKVAEIGGVEGQHHQGLLPTVDTLLFGMAGHAFDLRVHSRILLENSLFFRNHFFQKLRLHPQEPSGAELVKPSSELVNLLLYGHLGEPDFGADFPAEKLSTQREWDELVLSPETQIDINEVLDWIQLEKTVMEDLGLGRKVEPGFRGLFYGPPGTGKTFTTTLIGKRTQRPVFRVDLSQVVSKYIGETEKNLRKVFDKAEARDWILFFDEADALFGKRTAISDSKDRFANQEVSYLLQRIEHHNGVVLLATNHRDNLDKAFTRRFQIVVHFPMPNPQERLRLWQHAIPSECTLDAEVDLNDLAQRFELSGGSIMNVARFCVLQAARRNSNVVLPQDFMMGIKREYRKVGRIVK